MRVGIAGHTECAQRGRGRSKLTWEELVKKDLGGLEYSEELG